MKTKRESWKQKKEIVNQCQKRKENIEQKEEENKRSKKEKGKLPRPKGRPIR